MKACGLTGGVGMGKSTVADLLRSQGAQVVDTDQIARELVQPGLPAPAEIQRLFGKDILFPDGRLRRDRLAEIVFTSAEARQKLEAVLHPRIRERWLGQLQIWQKQNHSLAVVVIPLLFETHAEIHFDKVVCVACSENAQRHRLSARGWTPQQVAKRVAAQLPIAEKMSRSDFIVWTEGPLEVSHRQVEQILESL
jgi:dephospho-CoA kinase